MRVVNVPTSGNVPEPRFGHSFTLYAVDKAVLFGGATSNSNPVPMTHTSYTFDFSSRIWSKVEVTGAIPSPRAAHAAVSHQTNQILVYGGASDTSSLASDDLYLLDLKDNVGIWSVVKTVGKTPGKRYGHTLGFVSPYLVLFGGMTETTSSNDLWVLDVHKNPIRWIQIKSASPPLARTYHTFAIHDSAGKQSIIMYGGRSQQKVPLNDLWMLAKKGLQFQWILLNSLTQPIGCFQHSSLCIEDKLFVVGGRGYTSDPLPLQCFNLKIKQWINYQAIDRHRHTALGLHGCIYLYSGFKHQAVTTPTPLLTKITIQQTLPSHKLQQKQIQATAIRKPEYIKVMRPVIGESQSGRPMVKQTSGDEVAIWFINNLLQPSKFSRSLKELSLPFQTDKILSLCATVLEILKQQPIVLQIQAPVKIFGDIHGQYADFMSFFQIYGTPHLQGKAKDIQSYDYLFLGDYVDRGTHSLQTILLLLALKVIYPRQIHLIRGNHQDININSDFGFMEQCQTKCQQDASDWNSVYNTINRLFQWLPLAAIVQNSILCVHGGIGANVKTVQDIRSLRRPLKVMSEPKSKQEKVLLDLLWSDPTQSDDIMGITPNTQRQTNGQGCLVKFGPDIVWSFLQRNNLGMIIRAHECVMDGFERFAKGSLITVFSATNYCQRHKNSGAILVVKTNLQIIPKMIKPSVSDVANWIKDEEFLALRPPTPPRGGIRR